MQINNDLLTYTLRKNIEASVDASSKAVANTSLKNIENDTDTLTIKGEVIEASGVMTDEEYAKAVEALRQKALSNSKLATKLTLEDLKSENYQSEITGIKTAIFNYYHQGLYVLPAQDTSTYTFLNVQTTDNKTEIAFNGTDELVSWLKGTNNWDDEKSGLPLANLVKLTQDDRLEDAHQDFFGQLNRAFSNYYANGVLSTNSKLDKDGDSTIISYDELKNFFAEIDTLDEMKTLVQKYSDELQAQYDKLDLQGKLEFGIAKTREYLESMGMQDQLNALDRLLKMQDLHNDVHCGQISLADLNKGKNVYNEGMDEGAYNYMAYWDYDSSGSDYRYKNSNGTNCFKDFAGDTDDKDSDLGITIDYRVVDKNYDENAQAYNLGNWYNLVNTLVHELTHATAYQYYDAVGNGEITQKGLDYLEKIGAIQKGEYDIKTVQSWYNKVIYDSDWNRTYVPPELLRLEYLGYTAWGEYYAYQKDADYVDSIGGDVLDPEIATAGNGIDEKNIIDRHIKNNYNSSDYFEAVPDWKWWSYA